MVPSHRTARLGVRGEGYALVSNQCVGGDAWRSPSRAWPASPCRRANEGWYSHMGLFKRLCLAVWSLAGLFFSLALGLTRFGRWTSEATALLAVDAYLYAVQVCGAILLAGLVVTLVRAIVSRSSGSVEVASVEGGSVTITRDAIASQAAHVVGSDGTCVARDVIVTSGRRGSVDVHVKVLPYNSLDVMAKGPELHDRLVRELSALCGDRLLCVSLTSGRRNCNYGLYI